MQTMSADGFCMVENSVTVFFPASHLLAVLVTPQMAATNSTPGHISNNYLWFKDAGPLKLNGVYTKLVRACQNLGSRVLMGLESNTAIQNKWVDINQKKYEKMPKLHKPCEWLSKTFENNDCLLYTKIQWTFWSGVGKTWENKVWTQSVFILDIETSGLRQKHPKSRIFQIHTQANPYVHHTHQSCL